MEVLIGLVLLICILSGAGYMFRRKIYKEVDRLEARKIEVMNRSIIDELSKVKELKMTGQAEELFEQWRSEWDEILTSQLPKIEELLFDAEEFADKYRFNKSQNVLQHIDQLLTTVNENIDKIIEEINELVTSEEKNTVEGEEIKEQYKRVKKTLLAHSRQFGNAHLKLDEHLTSITDSLKEFDQETEQGNYLLARQILINLKQQLDVLQYKMEEIPKLLTECTVTIPNLVNELNEGYKEMKEAGYYLEHIQLDLELEKINTNLEKFKGKIDEAELDDVQDGLQLIQESVDQMYDLLEKEVEANQFVKQTKEKINGKLIKLSEQKKSTIEETNLVKQSYQLSETELDKQKVIEKRITQVEKKFVQIQQNLLEDQVAHSIVKEELEKIEKQISELFDEHNQYREMLQTLRRDELEAREKLSSLKRLLLETTRSVQQSNIPGLPEEFLTLIEKGQRDVQRATMKLEEIPLNMLMVNELLNSAVESVESLKQFADEIIEQVFLFEQIIQYGNRYRSRQPLLANKFIEAENLFREHLYKEALDTAAAAIEQVEPGSIDKIQHILNEQEDQTLVRK
ncbi:septation ring formation regulator EzrA [Bacillus sp. UMB0899]|uniref:septation ring formation regulator EzrA n=1 Tax=Metabacillus schmidteae TaxID=2730405 RepID=UPI000C80DA57|nr:septation ring formation regulator EzrA [Metabacillus schmidteae]PMC37026.1 septation ring formation regulator EzrA [Bacillus sp. UMB0899]